MNDDAIRLLRETPVRDHPRARLEQHGPRALALAELLTLTLDCGRDPLLPFRALQKYPTLRDLARASVAELQRVPGITPARAARLTAALELGQRMQSDPAAERPRANHPAQLAELLYPQMANLDHEELRVVLLDVKNRVRDIVLVYRGSVHTTVIRVAEIFQAAVRQNCPAVIVAHNHPSGEPTPSPEDIAVTRELVQAGKILDITVEDHIVIGARKYYSLHAHGLMSERR